MSNQPAQIEKRIIHINKSFANVETNLNSKITYNLKNPLHLRRNDTVSLVKAMVGERGLSADTISFTETQTITMKGHIYTQANSRKYGNFGVDKHLVQEFGYFPDKDIALVKDIEKYGPTNEPIFLVRIIPTIKDKTAPKTDPENYYYYIVPLSVSKSVVINPGNYTVAALASEVEMQLNGQQTLNNTFQNFVLGQQEKNKGFGGNFFDDEWLLGKITYKSIFPLAEFPSIDPQGYASIGSFLCGMLNNGVSEPGEGYCFLDGVSFNKVVNDGINLGNVYDINVSSTFGGQRFVYYGLSQGPVSAENISLENPNTNTMKYNIYGASEFQMIYDTETINRFSIANLHTPLKIPNFGNYNTSNPNAGQQCTKFDGRDRDGDVDNRQNGFYPLECSSGFVALSFDYEKVKETSVYKEIIIIEQYELDEILQYGSLIRDYWKLNCFRHYEYYPNNIVPDADFETRFWDRLGFTSNQLYNFSNNIETYQQLSLLDLESLTPYSMRGIITHNDSSFSMSTSSGGLGEGILTTNGVPFQPYSTFGILGIDPTVDRPDTQFNILTTSKYLTAEKYPDLLGGKNYYIVKSNLITNNYYDVKSNQSSILGLINFNFVSNDTIFSTEGIEYPITQDKVLTQITMELTNPDGSPVSEEILSKNSGFLIQIVRNITPELELQELENKPVKDPK